MSWRRRTLGVGAFAAGILAAQANEPPTSYLSHGTEVRPPDEQPGPFDRVVQRPLFRNWDWRKRLADDGVTLIAQFVGEPAWNDRGYRGTGSTYAQDLQLGAVLNLRKLGWRQDDGVVRILFSDRTGTAAANNTGAYIQDQGYWGQGENLRLDELDVERTFLSHRLDVKGGFYSMGNDFGGLPYLCNFNTSGTCGHPLGPIYGSGWRDSPTGAWGGRIKWKFSYKWYAQIGTYDVTPDRTLHSQGFNLDFSNTTGVIVPVEVGYVHGSTPDDYPGTYKIEGYYDSSRVSDIGEPGRRVNGREGGYIQGAQQIWKAEPGSVRGLSAFVVATLSDPETALFRTYYEAGLSWRGPVKARADDWVSLAWMEANINPDLRRLEEVSDKPTQTREQLLELNYTWQATPWCLVRPALQYAMRPGGYEARPDTFIFSAHIQITF